MRDHTEERPRARSCGDGGQAEGEQESRRLMRSSPDGKGMRVYSYNDRWINREGTSILVEIYIYKIDVYIFINR